MWLSSVRTSHLSHGVFASSFPLAPATFSMAQSLPRLYRSTRSGCISTSYLQAASDATHQGHRLVVGVVSMKPSHRPGKTTFVATSWGESRRSAQERNQLVGESCALAGRLLGCEPTGPKLIGDDGPAGFHRRNGDCLR